MSAEPASLLETLALRERYRDAYWAERDPIAEDRLLWRAQAFRHTVHFLPGQPILELGSGGGAFTRALLKVTRGENPIAAVGFQQCNGAALPAEPSVERIDASGGLEQALAGRRFDFIVGMDLLDARNSAWLLKSVHGLLNPGGKVIFYESNPWNVVLKLKSACARLLGRPDPRSLLSQPRLYELCSEIGFIRVFAVFNDFVFAPLTRSWVWFLRNLSIMLENAPGVRTLAGSILLHAEKPPRREDLPGVSLCRHASLRGAVSVVIPCHNEEMNVGPLVGRLLSLYGDYVHEIVLVDDNSTDGTREAIEELQRREPRVRGVFRSPPNGVGLALQEGLAAATGRLVLTSDCDFQHLLPEFRDLFDAAAEGWDVVVGSRFSRHSVLLNYPFGKIVSNRAFHSLAQVLFLRRFRDLTNNLKLMRREVVRDLILREPGFAVNAEIGLQPVLQGRSVREVPISWINRTPDMGASSFKLAVVGSGYCRVLGRLLLARALRLGPYRRLARAGRMRSTVRSEAAVGAPRPRRIGAWFLLAALLLTAAARAPLLERQGLWVDEVFSLALATGHSLEQPAEQSDPALGDFVQGERARPAAEWRGYLQHDPEPAGPGRVVRAVLLSDTSPPLYYLALWAWTLAAGTSDLALRGFSLACALACVPFVLRLARWSGGHRAVLPACALFALAPLSVYYGTEGRMYSLLWLCVVACAWFTVVVRARPSAAAWAAWVAAGACGLLTHYFFALVWGACGLFLLLRPGRAGRPRVVLAGALTALLVLPWYSHLAQSLAGWRVTQDWLTWKPSGFSRPAAALELFLGYFAGSDRTLWGEEPLARQAALALFALLGAALLWRWRGRTFGSRRLLLWLWLGAAWAGPMLFDALRGTYTAAVPRYAAAGLPAALLLAAAGAACLGPRALRLGALALVCAAWLPHLKLMHYRSSRSWCPLREVAGMLESAAGPQDLIVVHSIPSGVLGVARYYCGEAPLAAWVEQLGERQVPGSFLPLARADQRVALVRVHEVGAACPLEDWLRANASPEGEGKRESARLLTFALRGPGDVLGL
jgi:SAM-dependent methyltransferase